MRHLLDRSCYMENMAPLLPAIKFHLTGNQKQPNRCQHKKCDDTECAEKLIVHIGRELKSKRSRSQCKTILLRDNRQLERRPSHILLQIANVIIGLSIVPRGLDQTAADRLIQISLQPSHFDRTFARHRHELRKSLPAIIEKTKYFIQIEWLGMLLKNPDQFQFQASII